MRRITARNVLRIPKRLMLWSDGVLWGKPLGRLIILAVLLQAGIPAIQAGPASEYINRALDALIPAPTVTQAAP